MKAIFKNIERNYIIYLLPIIYSLVIVCYPYPKEFDINWRYVEFYNYITSQPINLENVSVILQQSPDFIFQILIILFAKLNIPIKVLFFIITWVTVFNFLFVYKYYSKKFDVNAPIKSYIIVFCAISVAAVLSGVRNIHALSFIAISMLLYREKKFSLMLLSFLYAVGTHFSVSVYGLIFLLINLFRLKTSFIIVTILSLFLLVLNVMPISLYESLLSESLFRKVKFYLMGEDIYLSYFKNFQSKTEIELRKLIKSFLPVTIWERHFKNFLPDDYNDILKDNHEQIRIYRNDVMHFHTISKKQYMKMSSLISDAIDELNALEENMLINWDFDATRRLINDISASELFERIGKLSKIITETIRPTIEQFYVNNDNLKSAIKSIADTFQNIQLPKIDPNLLIAFQDMSENLGKIGLQNPDYEFDEQDYSEE